MRKNALDSNYKISSKNGETIGVYSPKLKKMIIGVPRDFDLKSTDAGLIFETQIPSIDIPDYYNRLFQFSKDKRETIEKGVKYLLRTNRVQGHMGKNLKDVFNYCFHRDKMHRAKILAQLFDITDDELTERIATLNRMFETARFGDYVRLMSGCICAYNLISPSFAETGKGYLYVLTTQLTEDEIVNNDLKLKEYLRDKFDKNKFSINKGNSKEKDFSIDDIYDIENYLDNILGLKNKYEKWEIQTMYKYIHIKNNYSEFIEEMMSE